MNVYVSILSLVWVIIKLIEIVWGFFSLKKFFILTKRMIFLKFNLFIIAKIKIKRFAIVLNS